MARTASRSIACRIARNTSGATEYGACAARLVRTRSVGDQRIELTARLIDEAVGIGRVEPNQLVEHDAGERAARQRLECHERVADVSDERGAAANRLSDALFDAPATTLE